MHSFQEMDLDYFECNPFKKIGKDLFVITAEYDGKVNTMTAGWGGFGVMWGKNIAVVAIRNSRYTKEFVDKADRFSMTFFEDTSENRLALKYIATVSGRNEDKIKNAKLCVDYSDGVPYMDDGNLVFIVRKMYASELDPKDFIDGSIDEDWYKDGDYHTIYVAEIEKMMAR